MKKIVSSIVLLAMLLNATLINAIPIDNIKSLTELGKSSTYKGMDNYSRPYNLEMMVEEVIRGRKAQELILDKGELNKSLSSDKEYVIVQLLITPVEAENKRNIPVLESDFRMYGKNGKKYNSRVVEILNEDIRDFKLGKSQEMYVSFEVDRNDNYLAMSFREDTLGVIWFATKKDQKIYDEEIARGGVAEVAMASGEIYGILSAEKDYLFGNNMNKEKALNLYEMQESIPSRFRLYIINETSNGEFVRTFRANFLSAYEKRYIELFNANETNNVNSFQLGLNEVNFTFSEGVNQIKNGSNETTRINNILRLNIEENTFYDKGILEIKKLSDNTFLTSKYKQVYNPYSFTISRKNGNNILNEIESQKDIKLSFKSVENTRAGIYKYKNGKWLYQKTEILEDRLEHIIPAGTIKNGTYALLIDENYPIVNSINLNWAYDELNTFIRRGYIRGVNNLNPNAPLTRKELANLIYEIKNPNIYYMESEKEFVDADQFGTYKVAIDYVYRNGIMNGISETQFSPNGYVTYKDFEVVMSRVLGYKFSYDEIKESMFYDKYKISNISKGMNTNVTISEAVYALFKIFN